MLFNQVEADSFRESVIGPSRCLLNNIKDVLLFRDGRLFPERKVAGPVQRTDNLLFYMHCVTTLQYYQKGNPILKADREAGIERLKVYQGAQKVLTAPDAVLCSDFLVTFDVLLHARPDIDTIRLDKAWAYEVLSRALRNDARLTRTLSRPEDFEVMSSAELWDEEL